MSSIARIVELLQKYVSSSDNPLREFGAVARNSSPNIKITSGGRGYVPLPNNKFADYMEMAQKPYMDFHTHPLNYGGKLKDLWLPSTNDLSYFTSDQRFSSPKGNQPLLSGTVDPALGTFGVVHGDTVTVVKPKTVDIDSGLFSDAMARAEDRGVPYSDIGAIERPLLESLKNKKAIGLRIKNEPKLQSDPGYWNLIDGNQLLKKYGFAHGGYVL